MPMDVIRKRQLLIVMLNLPLGTTPTEVESLMWERLGLHVQGVSTKDTGKFSASAFMPVTEDDLLDLLARNFDGMILGEQRDPVRFERKRWKEDEEISQQRFRNYKVNVDQVTVKL